MNKYIRNNGEISETQLFDEICKSIPTPDLFTWDRQTVTCGYEVALTAQQEADLYTIIDEHVPIIITGDEKYVHLDLVLSGPLGTSSSTLIRIAKEVIVPPLFIYGATKVEAKVLIEYFTQGGSTGETQLFDYKDYQLIFGTNEIIQNVAGWTYNEGKWHDITIYEKKSLSLSIARNSGVGNDQFQVEAAQIILKYT